MNDKYSNFSLLIFCTTDEDEGFRDFRFLRSFFINQALRNGVKKEQIISKERKDFLNTDFYERNKEVLELKRGAGFWLWKPYFILEELKKLNEGEFLIYSDCKNYLVGSLKPLLKLCEKNDGFYLIEDTADKRLVRQWTKRDCLLLMNADTPEIIHSKMCDASFQIYRKNDRTVQFLSDLLKYSEKGDIITDAPNKLGKPNYEDYSWHRHDQSILSILRLKYKIRGFRRPSERKNYRKAIPLLLKSVFSNSAQKIEAFNYLQGVVFAKFMLNKKPEEHRTDFSFFYSLKQKLFNG